MTKMQRTGVTVESIKGINEAMKQSTELIGDMLKDIVIIKPPPYGPGAA